MKHVAKITIALVEHYYRAICPVSSMVPLLTLVTSVCPLLIICWSEDLVPCQCVHDLVASQLYYRELLHLCVSRFFSGMLSGKISSVPVSLLLFIFCKIVSNSREQTIWLYSKGKFIPSLTKACAKISLRNCHWKNQGVFVQLDLDGKNIISRTNASSSAIMKSVFQWRKKKQWTSKNDLTYIKYSFTGTDMFTKGKVGGQV